MPNEIVPAKRSANLVVPELQAVDVLAHALAALKPTTRRAYEKDLADFARFVGQTGSHAAVELFWRLPHGHANVLALGYRTDMDKRGLKSATVARRLSALRWIVKLGRTLDRIDWALDVRGPHVEPYRDTKGPGDKGWLRMLEHAQAAAKQGTPITVRNLAILRTVHDLALRRAEVCALDLASVDLEASTLDVVGKGQTDASRFTLPPPTVAALGAWIELRGTDPGPLFVRLDRAAEEPTRLTADGLYLLIRELGRRAGVPKPVWPHGLRHQAITSLLDRTNGNIRMAQKYSRHADPRTLLRYDDTRLDLAGEAARIVAGDE